MRTYLDMRSHGWNLDQINGGLSGIEPGSLLAMGHMLGFYFNHKIVRNKNPNKDGFRLSPHDWVYGTKRVLAVNEIGDGSLGSFPETFPTRKNLYFIEISQRELHNHPIRTVKVVSPPSYQRGDKYPPQAGLLWYGMSNENVMDIAVGLEEVVEQFRGYGIDVTDLATRLNEWEQAYKDKLAEMKRQPVLV